MTKSKRKQATVNIFMDRKELEQVWKFCNPGSMITKLMQSVM